MASKRSDFLRTVGGGIGAVGLLSAGGGVLSPASALTTAQQRSRPIRRAVTIGAQKSRLAHTSIETANSRLTSLMDRVGCTQFVENGTLVRAGSLSRFHPMPLEDCLEPPNCGPNSQDFVDYSWGFDASGVGVSGIGYVEYNPLKKVDVFQFNDITYTLPSPYQITVHGPAYGGGGITRSFLHCTGALYGSIATAGLSMALYIKSNPSAWNPKVLFAAFQVTAGLLAPADFVVALGGLLASGPFLSLLLVGGLTLTAWFYYNDCVNS